MKKILGIAAITFAFAACNNAETTSTEASTDSTAAPQVVVDSNAVTPPAVQYTEGDIIKKEDGKVYVFSNGDWVVADKEIKLDNGTVIMPNGEVKNKEGKTITLDTGEYVNRSGNFFDKTGGAISNAWDKTKEGVSNAADATKNGLEKAADATKTGVEKGVDATKEAAHKTGDAIKKGAHKVGEKVKDVTNDIKN
ncbi:MAG TPA: DUF6799 domain-containing protein [Niabella sp.]